MKYILDISYKGTDFKGWQIQPNQRTVQGVLNQALSTILQEPIETLGSGRTDTGVHAKQQIVHFETNQILSNQFHRAINSLLPKDVFAKRIQKVATDFHARFDAKYRSYKYLIIKYRNPFLENMAAVYWKEVDLNLLNEACTVLKKHEDFESFSKVKTEVNNFRCEIMEANWSQENEQLVFYIKANRFLRGMVRAIVGTMLDVGTKRISLHEFEEIILSKKRTEAGQAAPPEGLYLYEVGYENL